MKTNFSNDDNFAHLDISDAIDEIIKHPEEYFDEEEDDNEENSESS